MHANVMFDCLCILLINVLSRQNTEFYNVKADYLRVATVFLRCYGFTDFIISLFHIN